MSRSFDQIEAQLNYDIVFAAEDFRDLVGYPFFYNLQVDLLHVNLLIELGRKFGRLHKSSISCGSHCGLCRGNKNAMARVCEVGRIKKD